MFNSDGRLFTLAEAASELPRRRGGKKTNVSTLYRWTSIGCRGVRLEYVQVGATRCTTREALGRFFERLTQNGSGVPAPIAPKSSSTRRLADERTERDLDAIGI